MQWQAIIWTDDDLSLIATFENIVVCMFLNTRIEMLVEAELANYMK